MDETRARSREERRNEFTSLLKLYYKWADKHELSRMFDLVHEHEMQFHWKEKAAHFVNMYKSALLEVCGDARDEIDLYKFRRVFPSIAIEHSRSALSIQELVQFLTANPTHIVNVRDVLKTMIERRNASRDRALKALFVSFTNLPELGWRPSLCMLHSPNTRTQNYYSQPQAFPLWREFSAV
jgi:hypothetical protein